MTGNDLLRWGFTVVLGIVGLWAIVVNYGGALLSLFRKKHHSFIPLIGGVAGSLALMACPLAQIHNWAWLPLLVDLGCAFSLLNLLYAAIMLKAFR